MTGGRTPVGAIGGGVKVGEGVKVIGGHDWLLVLY